MGTLMELDPSTVIYPGHAEPTTVADEREANPFIRVWRGSIPRAPRNAARWEAPRG